jgi:hypothetical protein
MVEKVGTVSAKLCTLQCILCVQDTNKKVRYMNFLHEVARFWISEVQITAKSNSDDLKMPKKQRTPRGPKVEKIVAGGKGKKQYPVRQCKVCAAHKKRSATRYICKFCIVPLQKGSCFEKYHTLRNY